MTKIGSFSKFIIEIMETDHNSIAWFLKQLIKKKNLYKEILLNNPVVEIRDTFMKIISSSLGSLYHDEVRYLKNTYNVYETYKLEEEVGFKESTCKTILF